MMRRSKRTGLLSAVAVAAAAALLGALSAFAGAGTAPQTATPTARGAYSLDFVHVLRLVAELRADPPEEPLVCLLGGSSARECTVSNASWSNAVSALRHYRVTAVNLGSKHRLFTQDRRLVGYLPKGTDIVFIGVNLGRFCNGYADPPVILPDVSGVGATRGAARASTQVWSNQRKRRVAEQWMVKRWPKFRERWRYNLGVLERVCRRSLARGQHPVIIDLPRNMPIIGHLLDRPLRMYHEACRRLARRLGIPYIQFQRFTGLTNRDFSDLWHTVRSGQVKWQRVLSATTARLIRRYGIGPAPSPSPSPSTSPLQPSADPTPSGSSTPLLTQ